MFRQFTPAPCSPPLGGSDGSSAVRFTPAVKYGGRENWPSRRATSCIRCHPCRAHHKLKWARKEQSGLGVLYEHLPRLERRFDAHSAVRFTPAGKYGGRENWPSRRETGCMSSHPCRAHHKLKWARKEQSGLGVLYKHLPRLERRFDQSRARYVPAPASYTLREQRCNETGKAPSPAQTL